MGRLVGRSLLLSVFRAVSGLSGSRGESGREGFRFFDFGDGMRYN